MNRTRGLNIKSACKYLRYSTFNQYQTKFQCQLLFYDDITNAFQGRLSQITFLRGSQRPYSKVNEATCDVYLNNRIEVMGESNFFDLSKTGSPDKEDDNIE